MSEIHVLVVDDEKEIADLVEIYLVSDVTSANILHFAFNSLSSRMYFTTTCPLPPFAFSLTTVFMLLPPHPVPFFQIRSTLFFYGVL